MLWLQPDGTVKLEYRANVLLLEKLKNAKDGKVTVDYEWEKSDPNNEPVAQGEEKEDSNAASLYRDIQAKKNALPDRALNLVCTCSTRVQNHDFVTPRHVPMA